MTTLPEVHAVSTFVMSILLVVRIRVFVSVKVSLDPDASVVLEEVIFPVILLKVPDVVVNVKDPVSRP